MSQYLLRYVLRVSIALLVLTGCMHDKVSHRYTFQRPLYESLAQARLAMKSSPAQSLVTAGKIAIYKNYLFISDPLSGIHVIDNKDPSAPVNLSFIPIYGNSNLAISNDVLYADDGYNELVTFNIANPAGIVPEKFMKWMFGLGPDTTGIPYAAPDSILVQYGSQIVDTTIYGDQTTDFFYPSPCANCALFSSSSNTISNATSSKGVNGSTSGFAIKDDYLYCLNGGSFLDIIDISSPLNPVLKKMTQLDGYYQTLFSLNDHLFMGSTLGMFIYDATDPLNVSKSGSFSHVQSCDPVIADGNFAFVTAWSGSVCGKTINELDVLDISSLANPVLKDYYKLTNPRGLAKDGDLLLICDGKTGLGTYHITDGSKVVPLQSAEPMETHDVIAGNGLAIVTAADGIYQYSYSSDGSLKKLSSILLNEKH